MLYPNINISLTHLNQFFILNVLKIVSFNNIYYFKTNFIKINNKADIYTWDSRKGYQKEGRICIITRGGETSMRASSVEKNIEYEEERRLVVFDFTVEIGGVAFKVRLVW